MVPEIVPRKFSARACGGLAYIDEGVGDPIVLVHGFASNKETNWVQPGWVSTLTRDNRRVIALDNRGHGQSTKLYDPADYHTDLMADDIARRCSIISGIARADIMGYSMGARNTAFLVVASRHARARALTCIIGGLGSQLIDGVGLRRNRSPRRSKRPRSTTSPTRLQGRMFPHLRGSDEIRFAQRARRLHPRLAAIALSRRPNSRREDPGAGCWLPSAPRTRSRARPTSLPRWSRGRVRSTSPIAITCSRSATRVFKEAAAAHFSRRPADGARRSPRPRSRSVERAATVWPATCSRRSAATTPRQRAGPVLLLHGGGQDPPCLVAQYRRPPRRAGRHDGLCGRPARSWRHPAWIADGAYGFDDFRRRCSDHLARAIAET